MTSSNVSRNWIGAENAAQQITLSTRCRTVPLANCESQEGKKTNEKWCVNFVGFRVVRMQRNATSELPLMHWSTSALHPCETHSNGWLVANVADAICQMSKSADSAALHIKLAMPSPHTGTQRSPRVQRSSRQRQWLELSIVGFRCISKYVCRQFNNSDVVDGPTLLHAKREFYKSHSSISLFDCQCCSHEWSAGDCFFPSIYAQPVIICNLFFLQLHQHHADNPLETEWSCFFILSSHSRSLSSIAMQHAWSALRWQTLRRNDKQWRMTTTPVIKSQTDTHCFFPFASQPKESFLVCFVWDKILNNFYRRVKNAEGNNNRQISHELLV